MSRVKKKIKKNKRTRVGTPSAGRHNVARANSGESESKKKKKKEREK